MIPQFWIDTYSSYPSDYISGSATGASAFLSQHFGGGFLILQPGQAMYIVGGRRSIVADLSAVFASGSSAIRIETSHGNVAVSVRKVKHTFGKNKHVLQIHSTSDGSGLLSFDQRSVEFGRVRDLLRNRVWNL
jgi:hypothetical protein